MFKKTAKNTEIKKFTPSDVQRLTEKELKQTMGGYQYPNLCFDYESGKYYKC
ncbi:hypothetical protein [Flavobacterium sp. HBTb2-11-1]|uniref:hypothetical protein n=1 Tax=Flavobacterium sp. HBTb2-11-1 TaxID=2692212 RepID=UPI00136F9DF6|nr:hypothetical protein [Flavobacterium sp. HBTb2-11-1]MXO04044.1 hypothetical protein [Flavobacterium sp. HBTb2-11-1]